MVFRFWYLESGVEGTSDLRGHVRRAEEEVGSQRAVAESNPVVACNRPNAVVADRDRFFRL
jgi:hypothetical protein